MYTMILVGKTIYELWVCTVLYSLEKPCLHVILYDQSYWVVGLLFVYGNASRCKFLHRELNPHWPVYACL
ncbi:hypothetical protein XENTR_v10001239 [Xenopus tropicalis]|nr:hypothetical protein XENTR_v10001239 [Xenopus tropicalis]